MNAKHAITRRPRLCNASYRYSVYGISLRSEIPLPLPETSGDSLAEIDLGTASGDWFVKMTEGVEVIESSTFWYEYSRLRDGSSYLRWEGVGEFLVPADGKTILCRPFDSASADSFRVYLLGQALSFALVQQGLEPLHATAIVLDGGAVVFLGDSGFGKSTLAACFLAAGHRLLTDDLLVLTPKPGGILAFPGPNRIKLFPNVARTYLGGVAIGDPMNPFTRKAILSLPPDLVCAAPVPLRGIYSLAADTDDCDSDTIRIDMLSPREGFVELLKNTFNRRIMSPDRLDRQFVQTGHLASAVPVRKISYPRELGRLPAVYEALLCDLCRERREPFTASETAT